MLRHLFAIVLPLLLWLQWSSVALAAPPRVLPLDPARVEAKDLTVSLFRRPDYSTFAKAVEEKDLKYFHWTVDASPKGTKGQFVDSFDASNGFEIRIGPKGSFEWNRPKPGEAPGFKFQYKYNVQPSKSVTLQARIHIGEAQVSTNQVKDMLQDVKIPCSAGESCADWVQSAIRRLQSNKLVPEFDVSSFSAKALDYGFERCRLVQDPELPIQQVEQENAAIAEFGSDGVIKKPLPPPAAPTTGKDGRPKRPGNTPKNCVISRRDGSVCVNEDGSIADPEANEVVNPRPTTPEEPNLAKEALPKEDVLAPEELVQLADKIAESEFASLMSRFGVSDLLKNGKQSFSELRAQFKGYSPLKDKSWAAKRVSGAKGAKGAIALTLVTLPLYFKDVFDVFTSESSTLEKVAAGTSILPVVGCATKAAADDENGEVGVASTSLCFVGETLLFTPLAPVGLLLRSIGSVVEFHEKQDPQNLQSRRDTAWDKHYRNITNYLKSDQFSSLLSDRYGTEVAAILSAASDARGRIITAKSLVHSVNGSSPLPDSQDKGKVDRDIPTQLDKIDAAICSQVADIKTRFIKKFPGLTVKWVRDEANDYNKQFIDGYERGMKTIIDNWVRLYNARGGKYLPPADVIEKERSDFQAEVGSNTDYLEKNSPLRQPDEDSILQMVEMNASLLKLPAPCITLSGAGVGVGVGAGAGAGVDVGVNRHRRPSSGRKPLRVLAFGILKA
ncbi:hypothetical protein HRG_001276 [Hirsutella rhossiliensis]|uniref:Heat Labile Enterotoxin Type Iib n=1 Tax=Hirsutella rhossiliensis TaxID=111463 RepID=A0A9P8N8E6_9HYPO|nr:uncharacterized protein HRG_01276 [Hirsutella rhossiliensis]KAH0968634.1 hypothetical protein HRG_01276 [Hirsutella rhossiliensis]